MNGMVTYLPTIRQTMIRQKLSGDGSTGNVQTMLRTSLRRNKLKKEHIDKLSGLGLKWAVHDRTRYASYTEPCESTTFVSKAMKVVPSKPALVSDSNKTSPDSGKNSSETDTNAIDCSSSKKVGAVVSDSSSAAALSGNEKVKEMKVAAK